VEIAMFLNLYLPRWRRLWWCIGLALPLGLSGCALVEHAGWRLATTPRTAFMQMGAVLLTGTVYLRPDRTGDLVLAREGSSLRCAGALRFTSVNAGAMDVRCSDGVHLDLAFVMVNEIKGHAFSQRGETQAALTFGMGADEAAPYLARAAGTGSP
jgi:hypothetical protein